MGFYSHLVLMDCGVTLMFSLPEAGSILMVTFFGLGVLVLLPLSDEMRTAGTAACTASPSKVRPFGMELMVRDPFVMDGRPPCDGQAVPRAAIAGLLTPGTSLRIASVKFKVVVPGQVTRSRLTVVRQTWQE